MDFGIASLEGAPALTAHRRSGGNARVHGAGAGRGRAGLRGDRRVLARPDALRAVGGRKPRRSGHPRAHGQTDRRAGAAASGIPPGPSGIPDSTCIDACLRRDPQARASLVELHDRLHASASSLSGEAAVPDRRASLRPRRASCLAAHRPAPRAYRLGARGRPGRGSGGPAGAGAGARRPHRARHRRGLAPSMGRACPLLSPSSARCPPPPFTRRWRGRGARCASGPCWGRSDGAGSWPERQRSGWGPASACRRPRPAGAGPPGTQRRACCCLC